MDPIAVTTAIPAACTRRGRYTDGTDQNTDIPQ